MNPSILVTVVGMHTKVSTVYFNKPKTTFVIAKNIWIALPSEKGTEIYNELGNCTLIVKESPEELHKLCNSIDE